MIPILHHYDASPFSRKAQKMLGIKSLKWVSIEMPMTSPKPDIERLTGGYRGTPVLQLGADIFVDNVAIAAALYEVFPEAPTLTADKSFFANDAISNWADALFEPVLRAAVGKYSPDWDPHFRNDREAVFPNLDFSGLVDELPLYSNRVVTLIRELDQHLSRGGPFIHGVTISIADVHCWGILWFVFAGLPEVSEQLAELNSVQGWYQSMDTVGFGERVEHDFGHAWEVLAENHKTSACMAIKTSSNLASWVGKPVTVRAEGADRGVVSGSLRAIDDRFFALSVVQENDSVARVYFPRAGYVLAVD